MRCASSQEELRMLTFVLSHLLAVPEMKCKFKPLSTAKIWLYHCQAFGFCL